MPASYTLLVFLSSSFPRGSVPGHPRASPAPEHGHGVGSITGPARPSPPGPSPGAVLTAGSLADDLDAPLLVALGFLQLALVAVGGVVGAADGSHHHGARGLLADAGGLGGVGGAPLAHRPEPAQHPSAGWGHRRGTPEPQHTRDVGQSPARGGCSPPGTGLGMAEDALGAGRGGGCHLQMSPRRQPGGKGTSRDGKENILAWDAPPRTRCFIRCRSCKAAQAGGWSLSERSGTNFLSPPLIRAGSADQFSI